jgi:hypothetical protein
MKEKNSFHGPLCSNVANPRYFSDDSGKAIYLTGSHTWAVMQDIWLESEPRRSMDYGAFLQMLEDYGHNFMRFWQWGQPSKAPWSTALTLFDPMPYERTGPGLAQDGKPKFDLTKWNEAYFRRLRKRIEQAGEHGVYASVMLFEAWCIRHATAPENDAWASHPMNPANNVNGVTDNPVISNGKAWNFFSLNCPQLLFWQKDLVKKVIDTVNDLDNVLFEIGNEVPPTREAMAWQNAMCDFVHEYESTKPKRHPVGITGEGSEKDAEELFATKAEWVSPNSGRVFEYRYNPPAADGRKVIVNDTDHLWGHGCEVNWIWKSFARGMNVLFMDPWERIPGEFDYYQDGLVSTNQRYYYLWDSCRRNMGHAREYSLRMDMNNCLPMNHLCTSTYCLACPGKEYLFFLPAGGAEGIELTDARGGFIAEWFDPRTGKRFSAKPLDGGKKHTVFAPFEGASVLYLWLEGTKEQIVPSTPLRVDG